jgi:predicted MFS family arabinose efflux permease
MLTATANLYKNAYSGLSRRMWLLATVMLINRSGTMVLPFMTLYCKHIGYTTQQGGWVVAIYGIGALIGAFLGGKISDRFGFYYIQFGSLFCGGMLLILLGQMNTYLSICICTFFLSMFNESFRPANSTAIAHYSRPENRTQAFSIARLAINVGWGIGAGLGGLLAAINYHLLFWVDGCTNILASLSLLWFLPRVTLAQQKQTSARSATVVKAVSAYKDKMFLYFIVLQLLFAICFFQLFTTVPLFFKEELSMNEAKIGFTMALNGIIIAILEMIIVFKFEGRAPYLRLMMIGSVIMALSFFMLNVPLSNGFAIAILATIIVTFAEMIAMPFMNTWYISRSTEGNRGQYAALYTMAWSAAQVIGSSSGTQLAHGLGFTNLWWIIGGICLLNAVGYSFLRNKE